MASRLYHRVLARPIIDYGKIYESSPNRTPVRLQDVVVDPNLEADIKRILRQSEVLVVDNVAEFYYLTASQDEWDIRGDFPNLAPPFASFWMEATAPLSVKGDGGPFPWRESTMPRTWGAWFHAQDFERLRELGESPAGRIPAWARPDAAHPATRWALIGIMFVEPHMAKKDSPPIGLAVQSVLYLDSTGAIVPETPENAGAYVISRYEGEDEFLHENSGYMYPFYLAISLLHCKNVNVREVVERPETTRSRKNRVKPFIRYHVLDIEPMKRVLRTEGHSEETGLRKALHICRGHFKDYREHGLFGSTKGIFWWDAHVRGTPASGIALKDYRVHPKSAG